MTRSHQELRWSSDTEFAANDLFGADGYVNIRLAADVHARETRREHAQNLEGMIVERDIWPKTSPRPPYSLCQKPWLSTAVPGHPRLSSAGVKVRPTIACRPRVEKNWPDA
jgi:hypothetical protein